MPNRDTPNGLRPLRGPFREETYTLEASNAVIGKGDLLELKADGTVGRAAATTVATIGVALEPKAASSTDGKILVSDHPETIYVAQTDDGTGTLTAQTGVNLNADIVVTDATNGVSRMEIDESSGATTATLPLKVVGLHKAQDNEFGEFNKLEVILNNHVLKSSGVAGV